MVHIANDSEHGCRGLLAGLHQKTLSVAGAVQRELADGGDGFFVERISRVLGDEAAVGLNFVDAE